MTRVPVIDITDLYHPPQDPGDNFDLIAAYALPEVDLRAIVLDCTDRLRQPTAGPRDNQDLRPIYRDPGFIPVIQLNSIFSSQVPACVGPFTPMASFDDQMPDLPGFQQQGIELFLHALRSSDQPLHVLSFGSLRTIAVALNREPDLLMEKIARVHVSAGAAGSRFREWNVLLDQNAFVRVLRSSLPVALYPCAADDGAEELGVHGAVALGVHNTYWSLPDLTFIDQLEPHLRRYLAYAIGEVPRVDFLRVLEEDPPATLLDRVRERRHNVWETAIWMQVTGRRLARFPEGWRLVPASDVSAQQESLDDGLRPCRWTVADDGGLQFHLIDEPSRTVIYQRSDPEAQQAALREALPALYRTFRPERESNYRRSH